MLLTHLQAEFIESLSADSNEGMAVNFNPAENISIYQNNVSAALLNTLRKNYPCLEKIIGASCFCATAHHYIQHYPLREANLNCYGEYFAEFLENFAPLKELVYLAEVAKFEWLSYSLMFASETQRLNIAALATLAESQYANLKFILSAAIKLQSFQYPILNIIELCETNSLKEVSLDSGGMFILFKQEGLQTVIKQLSEADFMMLDLLQNNLSLQECSTHLDDSFDLTHFLQRWVKEDVLVSCYFSS